MGVRRPSAMVPREHRRRAGSTGTRLSAGLHAVSEITSVDRHGRTPSSLHQHGRGIHDCAITQWNCSGSGSGTEFTCR